jgi:hypothetical protein
MRTGSGHNEKSSRRMRNLFLCLCVVVIVLVVGLMVKRMCFESGLHDVHGTLVTNDGSNPNIQMQKV